MNHRFLVVHDYTILTPKEEGDKMRRVTTLFVLIILTLSISSCSTPKKVQDFSGMDSNVFLESVVLPKKLSIDLKLDDIKSYAKVKIYTVEYITLDKQKLTDAFMKNHITDEKKYAEGPQVIASHGNAIEYLSIYDGGKSFGANTGLFGFNYFTSVNGNMSEKLNTVASISFGDPSGSEQIYGYDLNTDYASRRDLSFMPYQDMLVSMNRTLNKAGIPQCIVDKTFSLDLETMKAHYQLYLKSDAVQDDQKDLGWTKADESYILSLRQVVDGIPVVNHAWQMPEGTKDSAFGNSMPVGSINLIYDKTGIRSISASNVLTIAGDGEDDNLISMYQALKTLIDDYSLTILQTDVHIISAELCYLIIPGNGTVELTPGWIFCSTKAADVEYEGKTITEYRYDVVNAVTGKHYPSRW